MNKNLIILGICCSTCVSLFAQTGTKEKGAQLVLTNTTSLALKDKAVMIKRIKMSGIPAGKTYPILMFKNDTIPSQIDDVDGDQHWDELFFVTDLQPKERKLISIKWVSTAPEYVKRTSARFGKRSAANIPVAPATEETVNAKDLPKTIGFQKYQTDGPSWENDKVGFRHYLDGRNAKDVFGKLVPSMSPENVGINAKGEVEDNYHVMEKWGRDILAVGNSVGLGGIALYKDNQPLRLGVTVDDAVNNVEKTTFHIVTEGPTRSMLNYNYQNWNAAGKTYQVDETTSIWPGMYAYQNTVKLTGLEGNEDLAIGLVSINAENKPTVIKVNKEWVAVISHEKHTYNKEWWLGLALIVPADAYKGFSEAPKKGQLATSFLARLKVKNNVPVQYFAVAGWELSDKGFRDAAYFKTYVLNLVKQLSAPVKVELK
ncbi:DUF4861 domain-containing protein [Pedobacter sp.]|uniref:DUF4861 domain-containing protein n=1 Tax=Pedobacter sp. TaxID=1411316 RepID=UPI003D7F4366